MAGNGGGRRSSRDQRRGWARFWGGLSCFVGRARRSRVAPSSRVPSFAAAAAAAETPSPSSSAMAQSLTSSMLAPPSSPASSFAHSARSPSCCFLSSLEESPAFARGPYAGETQLVSPPVFSTFTTEPSSPELSQGCRAAEEGGAGEEEDVEASYRVSFGFSADELPAARGDFSDVADDVCSSFSMSLFPSPVLDRHSSFLFQPRGEGRSRGRRGSYYLSLSDAEVEYQRTRSWREDRSIFLHGYC
ncbi:uncharacterized protein LOC144713262 isoform X2 [Wolffia australiana]